MLPEERVLAAIAGRPTDRLPMITYNCHPFSGSPHTGDPGYAPVLEAIRSTEWACLCKVDAKRKPEAQVRTESRREVDSTVVTSIWETPRGPLSRVTRTPDGQPGMCIKHFIATEADLERYLSIPYTAPQWDVGAPLALAREGRGKALAYLAYPDPFGEVSELFDQEDFLIRAATDLPTLRRLHDFRFERDLADLQALLDAVGPHGDRILFYTIGPERATPPLMAPRFFDLLVTAYQKRLVSLLHERGHKASLHCHGRVRSVLPHVVQCGFDVLEPIEPPPQGDIGLEELLRDWSPSIALMGYVQDQDLHTGTPEQVRAMVRETARIARGKGRYIASPTCTPYSHPPAARYVENYLALLEEAEKVF